MAGHSKWANIQHRKGRQDAARSKLFSKLAKEITVAAKMGDPDPDKNPRLRLAVKEAKSNSVPKDVIQRAIDKSHRLAGGEDYKEIRYEGYGPGGGRADRRGDDRQPEPHRLAMCARPSARTAATWPRPAPSASCSTARARSSMPPTREREDDVMEAAIEAGAEDVESGPRTGM